MNRNKRNSSRRECSYAKLEDKILLAVTAAVNANGTLQVGGVADGLVEIVASEEPLTQFIISDDGVEIARVNGVTQHINVDLALGDFDNSVRIDLMDEVVKSVVVEFGDGDNELFIEGDAQIERVIYRGGSGTDDATSLVNTEFITAFFGDEGDNSLFVNSDTGRIRYRGGGDTDTAIIGNILLPGVRTTEYAGMVMGDGNNTFTSYMSVGENQYFRGGEGQDTVSSLNVAGTASMQLSNGNDRVHIQGETGRLFIRGGFDNDAVIFGNNAVVQNRMGIKLWGGDDFIRVDGSIFTDIYFNATDGNDQFFLAPTSLVVGDVNVLFGPDDNSFTQFGEIDGDLYVASKNVNDNFAIGGTVSGNIRLRPGGQP